MTNSRKGLVIGWRSEVGEGMWGGDRSEIDAELGSTALRRKLETHFRKWEDANGFQRGAGALLVPAGYQP